LPLHRNNPEEELVALAGRIREAMEQSAEAVKVLRVVAA